MKQRKVLPPHVRKWLDHLAEVFEVKNWDKTHYLPKKDEGGIAASIEVNEDYQRLYIRLYPAFFKANRYYQREYLLHEFCHILTRPLVDLLDDFKRGELVTPKQIKFENERATSRISLLLDGYMCRRFTKETTGYREYLKEKKRKTTKVAKSKTK